MDLITQGVLGAAVAQAGFQKKLRKQAIIIGALVGMLPDVDVFVGLSKNPYADILYHRGLTHSFFFAFLMAPLLAWICHKIFHGKNEATYRDWFYLNLWVLITHSILDLFTIYGTQLLFPFSDRRFAISAIPIVDLHYTGILILGICLSYRWRHKIFQSQLISSVSLFITTAYICAGWLINMHVEKTASEYLLERGIEFTSLKAYTTFGNIFERRVVVRGPDQVRVGFCKMRLDSHTSWIAIQMLQDEDLLRKIKQTQDYKIFEWFTGDDLCVYKSKEDGCIYVTDVRYGMFGKSVYGLWGIKVVSLNPLQFERVSWSTWKDLSLIKTLWASF